MKYDNEMASGGMMDIPSFIKISSSIQKLLGGRHMQIHAQSKVISYAYFIFF